MLDTRGNVANPWLSNYFANPIPQVFPGYPMMITSSSMSSPITSVSSFLSPCRYRSMGMLHETNLEDESSSVDFSKFQHLMNFARMDDTNQDIGLDRSGKTNFMDRSDENSMAIDLSRTPETNYIRFQEQFSNRFQETTNLNNRFHEDINYNLSHHAGRFAGFGSSMQYPDYSTFSANTDKSLVNRHRQNSCQRQAPYQRVNVKRRRSSNPDDVSSTVDPPPHRANANDRERERTRNLNAAFAELRTHVPSMPSDKLSKIQTLRLASKYIHFLLYVLQNGLGGEDVDSGWNCRLLTHERLGKKFSMWRLQGTWTS